MPSYEKTYLKKGSAKKVEFSNGGHVINISILEENLKDLPRSNSKSGETYVNFSIGTRREEDDYGNTHSVYYTTKEGSGSKSSSGKDKGGDNWDWE